jgi:hypothetical protein
MIGRVQHVDYFPYAFSDCGHLLPHVVQRNAKHDGEHD